MTLQTVGGLRLSKSAAKEARQHLSVMTKQADAQMSGAAPGQDQETQFEQAFAQLAFTYLRDRAPALVPHLVGFQLVDRNDDNTKAIGIFGFRIGGSGKPQWLYAPMFFMNNRIKGQNLLYVKGQDRFVPLTEKRINALMRNRPSILGQGVQGNAQQNGVTQPNWRLLSTPPVYRSKSGAAAASLDRVVKLAAANRRPLAGWFVQSDGVETMAKLAYAELPQRDPFTPLDLASRYFDGFCVLADMAERYPQIKTAMAEFYGADKIQKVAMTWANRIAAHEAKEASVLTATPPVIRRLPKVAAERITYEQVVNDAKTHSDLTDSERESLVRDGYLLKDYRKNEEHSTAYSVSQDTSLHTPGETGIYHVLVADGKLEKMLVVRNPYATHERHSWMTLVRLSSPRSWINCYPTSAFVRTDEAPIRSDFTDFFKKLPEKTTLKEDGVYLVLTESGEGSVPFRVREVLEGGQYRVRTYDSCNDEPLREESAVRSYLPQYGNGISRYDARLHSFPEMVEFTDRRQTKLRQTANTLVVPPEARVVVLQEPPDGDDWCCSDVGRSKSPVLQLGDLATMEMAIRQKTASLRLWSDGSETRINSGAPQSQADALFTLVRDHALPEKQARAMIAEAVQRRQTSHKLAEFRVFYGPGALPHLYAMTTKAALVEPSVLSPGTVDQNSNYTDFPEQMPQQTLDIPSMPNVVSPEEYNQVIPGLMAQNTTDPNTYNMDPMSQPDPALMQQAQQAAQMGQKELFDAAGLQTMLKTMRRDIVSEDDISQLIGAVDTLGKILFKFYWHNDDFEERFGKADLPELEDSLSNNFEGLDEFVLMMEEKDLTPIGSEMQADNESVANN